MIRYTEKTRTWKDNWNNVIRDVLFPDEKLRELMLLPDDVTVTRFIDKYFIEDEESSDEIMTDEPVRIVHHDSEGVNFGNAHVRSRYKEFDIYIKNDVLHTATRDRLQNRYDLITERLKYLLIRHDTVCHLRFRFVDDYNLFTKTTGYKRYHVVFAYKTTV